MYNLLLTTSMISKHNNKLLSYKDYPAKETIRKILSEVCEHAGTVRTELLKPTLIQDFDDRYTHQSGEEGCIYRFKNDNGVVPYTCQSLTIGVHIYPIDLVDTTAD